MKSDTRHGSAPAARLTRGESDAPGTGAGSPSPRAGKTRLADVAEVVMLSQSRSVAAEKFRRLKTILSNDPDGGPQVIVVTSPAPAEGKTVVSTNLALAFAADRSGGVVLIDADLRRPAVDVWLNPKPKQGLSEVLRGKTSFEVAVLELDNSPLRILPAGQPATDPVELLSSDAARSLVADLRKRYSRIIIDTPPIGPFTDADVAGMLADGILIVARSGSTPRALLVQALGAVTSTRVLGTVLNDTTYSLADRDNYYIDQQYHRYYEQGRR